jgi:hyperosmotically inducible periplasmic protein
MKTLKSLSSSLALSLVLMAGCSHTAKSPDVAGAIRQSLDQAGLKDVSVSQDRDKGVVTLGGQVADNDSKTQAETIAKSIAGPQVVANEVGVVPADDHDAKTVNSDIDKGIEKDLDAALVQNHVKDGVSYDVKNGVVKLTGEVSSQARRTKVEQVASQVPHVMQVVDELQVKNQKATSTS